MKTVGIIAEYNPFHNGHAYQIKRAKELAGADFAVIVMSPDFVQRGEPALLDKYSRTRMALLGGADLVIELPVCYATGSAEYFAEGSTALLEQLGCVDVLSFGCETADSACFSRLADFLLEAPEEYRLLLRSYQKTGMTFPKAREAALLETFADELPDQAILSSPNNILGLEYTKALKKMRSPISILPVPRAGSGYHSLDLDREFCSASAIRAKLTSCPGQQEICVDELAAFLPEACLNILKDRLLSSDFVMMEQFSALLHYKLLSEAGQGFCHYLDVTSDLSDRILRLLPRYSSVSQFVSLLKTKQLTEARIRRALLHILLNVAGPETEVFRQQGTIFYGRILGFRKTSVSLMHAIKKNASVPLISKLADAKNILCGSALQMLTQDVYASHIYRLPACSRNGKQMQNEYTCSPVIL